jgi:hypothetical protein
MKNVVALWLSGTAMLLGMLNASVGSAQEIPRAADGKPDFTGVWAGPGFAHTGTEYDRPTVSRYSEENFAPLRAGAESILYRAYTGDIRIDDPTAYCLPNGLSRQIPSPYPQQWVQTPSQLIILYEYMHFFRVISIGEPNRPHDPDVQPTYMGDSIAWWEGDTLVIDSTGITEWVLDAYHAEDGGSRWHSDQLHVVERIAYTSPTKASYEVTIDDPAIFTEPWVQPWEMELKPTWRIFEMICEDNNRCRGGECTPHESQLD